MILDKRIIVVNDLGDYLMEIKILKIDGEFVVVELKNGEKRICPTDIFPENIRIGDSILILKKKILIKQMPNQYLIRDV